MRPSVRTGCVLVAALVCAPVGARAEPASGAAEAIVLLDREPADAAAAGRVVRAIRQQVARAYRAVPAPDVAEIARPDPACSAGEMASSAATILVDMREGQRQFYEETSIDAARTALARGFDRSAAHPCVMGRLKVEKAEVCSGAVLLVRVHLMDGKPEAASAVARRMSVMFPKALVDAVDVPPEVGRFLAGVREDVDQGSGSLRVRAVPEAAASGAVLVVDGAPAEGSQPWSVKVASGQHEVTVLLGDGSAVTRRVAAGPDVVPVEIDLVLAGAVVPGPEGSLALAPARKPGDAPAVARRLAEVTGRTILVVRDEAGASLLGSVQPSGPVRDRVAAFRPIASPAGAFEVAVAADGPLAVRPSWPWPWAAAGASGAFLTVAAVMNWQANRETDKVNQGTNRVSTRGIYRGLAIGGYTVSAAAAAAAVVLYFTRPAPQTRFVVTPAGASGTF